MAVCLVEPGVRPLRRTPERSVLAVARGIVERGWLQHGWCTDNRPSRVARLLAGPPRPDEVEQACLVAALTVAAHRGGRLVNVERDAMPWIAHVWRCLPGAAGRRAPALRGPWGAAVIRDLTAWNDAPHRTRDDVVALLERAERLAPVG
ncbi:hypothetical protein GCM10010472_67630 [Pseudonocardia halophobica]|uniref:Uncharacterized protein n=1 Tax=Pseudonocardia halophobica TaxID=29401 RepID=A0A9W6L3Q7_9PSEU|nr:hypothetical protein [Pseudonocardia halophobica]GLL12668.1 hypothetical protein GCM10017577_38090 [Pseudonocardia halophobica]